MYNKPIRKERYRKALKNAGLLFLAVMAVMIAGSRAQAKSEDLVVRVGFYDIQGFQEYDDLGNPVGYNIEYLQKIAALTGWEYEYVEVDNFTKGMERLKNREIDLLAPCQMTQERLETFGFSNYPFGTEYVTLVTTAGNTSYSYEDYDSLQGISVGVVKDYLLTDQFEIYQREHGFVGRFQYYDTPNEALRALLDGKVNAAVANLLMVDARFKVLARFSPAPFYYMTWKGNKSLMEQLDAAMLELKTNYPNLENEMTQKYFPLYSQQYFSGEEEKYAASLGKIKIGYVKDCSPVSFTNEEGEFDGMTRSVIEWIQAITGLQFEYVELPEGDVTYDYLRDHGIVMVSSVEHNSANINAEGLWLSNPYLSMRKVMVVKDGLVFNKSSKLKVAISTGSQTIKLVLAAKYPNFEIVDYETIGDCFKAVKKGKADMLIQNQYVSDQWLSRPQYEGMRVIPVEGLEDNLCFSIITNQNAAEQIDTQKLIAIINKAISQIPHTEIDTIIVNEVMENRYRYTIWDFLYQYKYTAILMVVLIIAAFAATVYIMDLKRRALLQHQEEEKKLLLQQKRYQLILDKSEEIIYEINLKNGQCIVSDKMENKFGWTFPDQIKGADIDALMDIWRVHQEDRKKLQQSLKNMIHDNSPEETIVRMQKADGDYIWCKIARYPLMDNDNILVSIVGKIADIDEEVKEKEKLELRSRMDGLTRLLNKKTFEEEVKAYLKTHKSAGTAIVFLDLDHFKEVNDNLGHMIGDKAIKDAADKLRVVFDKSDLLGRFGGDEFCIFMKARKEETVKDKLGWIVDKLRETYTDGAKIVRISVSAGAVYNKKEDADYQTMLDEADRALYEAKEKGRNQFILRMFT